MPALWFDSALLPDGFAARVRLRHEAGVITHIDTGTAPEAGDECYGTALPGLCNVHSHAFQRGMAGLTEYRASAEDDFWSWRALMYRFLDRMSPDDVQAVAELAYAEMLESGFTRVGEFHYLHHAPDGRPYADIAVMAQAIAAASAATGIGLTLLPVYYETGNFGNAPPSPGQRRFLNDPDRFARLLAASGAAIAHLPDAVLGVAPHSLRAVPPDHLRAVIAMAPGAGPLHIHAAEQTREVEDCLAWSGARPVEWLLDNAGPDARWTLIHATHMTEAETDRLAASGATAGLCPVTEANLGDGIFPARRYLAAGGAMAVGTDSNILVDAAGELRELEYSQRLAHRRRNVLAGAQTDSTGETLFRAALAGGARALGVPAGLRAGLPADIVALDPAHPALLARQGARSLDGWVFAAGRGAVHSVWRHGRRVVTAGVARNKPAILARYAAVLRGLLAA